MKDKLNILKVFTKHNAISQMLKEIPNANKDRSMCLDYCNEDSMIFSYNLISFTLNVQSKLCAIIYYHCHLSIECG